MGGGRGGGNVQCRRERKSGPDVDARRAEATKLADQVGFHEFTSGHGTSAVAPHGGNLHVSCSVWGLAEMMGNRGMVVGEPHRTQMFSKSLPQRAVCFPHIKLVAEATRDDIDDVRG